MAVRISIFVIMICAGIAQYSANQVMSANITEISRKLKLVVTVDGKSFFADNSYRNWTEASIYCQDLGMKLASITSLSQFSALSNAYSPDFNHWYWTSGRESRTLSQFVWNNTNDELSSNYLSFEDIPSISYQTCVVFQSTNNPVYVSLFPYLCSTTDPGTLCET